jgi:eukaryotic-like serine/threonine-protein kinase
MPLCSGTRVGPYEITAPLGVGGMGEVYRVNDLKLGRAAALKVLSSATSGDPDYMARFTREAQVLASLNHSNIAAIYGLEDSGGIRAIVMELVEGVTLAERIAAGPLPIDEALGIARQIADALEAAHEKGIIHRDLKPANVKITPAGVVKILDFGLAKTVEPAVIASANSPTLTMRATDTGIIMGTAAYMSPEQARGMPLDKRTDIWAYGVVLFEMLTGREMFPGETVSDILAGVLRAEFDWRGLSPSTPPPVQRLLRRCLQRDRKKRLADIADARLEIDEALAGAPLEREAAPPAAIHRRLPWVVASLFALAAVAASLLHLRQSPPEQLLLKFSVAPPEGAAFGTIAISPNGRRLAYTAMGSGKTQLWVRPLDSLTTHR